MVSSILPLTITRWDDCTRGRLVGICARLGAVPLHSFARAYAWRGLILINREECGESTPDGNRGSHEER
jgi:hypothetical protein